MSHVADVTCKYKSLELIEAGLKHIPGAQLIRGQKTHKWYGRFLNDWTSEQGNGGRAAVNRRDPATFGKCDHAIKLAGVDYEIGVVKDPDGTFTLVYDTYGGAIERVLGEGLKALREEINCATAIRQLARNGFRANRVKSKTTGKLTLEASNG